MEFSSVQRQLYLYSIPIYEQWTFYVALVKSLGMSHDNSNTSHHLLEGSSPNTGMEDNGAKRVA
jgi:hypothetical protein